MCQCLLFLCTVLFSRVGERDEYWLDYVSYLYLVIMHMVSNSRDHSFAATKLISRNFCAIGMYKGHCHVLYAQGAFTSYVQGRPAICDAYMCDNILTLPVAPSDKAYRYLGKLQGTACLQYSML